MRAHFFFAILMSLFMFPTLSLGAVREYHLTLDQQKVTIREKTAVGMTINGTIPGPTLRFQEGDLARIYVTNMLPVSSSIHWHGILVPPDMDGVPLISQVSIAPGDTHLYEFPIKQTGTYWYHSHSELQEQSGLYGSIVIEDHIKQADSDHVILLSEWTTDSPESIMRTLKRGSEWFSLQKGSSQSIFGATKTSRLKDYFMRELQRMPPMDIADVAYDYFLSNDKPEIILPAEEGDTLRLRIINGSATTYFHLNYSGGPMTIISSDGQLVEPVEQELFLVGVAETYDVLVTVPGRGAYELRATAHDGSGFTSTWIGTGTKHTAREIPKPDLYEPMHQGGMGSLFALTPAGSMGMSDSKVEAGVFDKPGMVMGEGAMDHGASGEMIDHNKMNAPDHDSHSTMNMNERTKSVFSTDSQPIGQMHGKHQMAMPGMKPQHEKAEHGEIHQSDQNTVSARQFGGRYGLLETDNGSRTNRAKEGGPERPGTPYLLLKSPRPTVFPPDAPVREIRLTLDGDMERYTWFLNNKPLSESDHILIKEGETVRFIMINRTMMHHPMHLHGHFFRVLNGQEQHAPLKHTVDVAPMSTTVIEFYGNEVGDWFFHCHLLYHMETGMARLVHYQNFTPADDVAAVRKRLYKDPFYFYGYADVLNSMTEGTLTLANSRYSFAASWEVGWQRVDETDWEGLLTGDYHLNRFTSFLAGVDTLGEGSSMDDIRGIFGLRYLLPLNFKSTAWLDTDGGARFILEKTLDLTPRLGLQGEVEYDTHKQWESKIGLSYLILKNLSLITNWHSEYGFGAGLQIRF